MEHKEIAEKIKQILIDLDLAHENSELIEHADLKHHYGMTSIELIDFIVKIEEEFNIEFTDSELHPNNFISPFTVTNIIASMIN